MSDVILEEAQKGFREILEGKLQETWGKYLTEDNQDEILSAVAELVAVYLVSLERRWCIANPDRLSIRFRGLVESIIHDAFSRVGAFVIADNIADFSADVFNQIKLIVDDHSDHGSDNESDNGANAFNVESEIDEVDLYNLEYDEDHPSNAGGDEEASNGTSAMAVRLYSPGPDSVTFESDEEMVFDANDENFQGEAQAGYLMTTDDQLYMDNRYYFSTPARSDEGDENMADDTLTVEDMAYSTPVQEGMDNNPFFFSVAGSDMEDQDMEDHTFADGDVAEDDLSYQDTENDSGFSSPARSEQRDEDMANDPHVDEDATNETPPAEDVADDTPTASLAELEEEDEDNDAANSECDNELYVSPNPFHAMEFANGHMGYEDGCDAEPVQLSVTNKEKTPQKDKSPQKGPRGMIDPYNNDLFFVVMGKNNTTWPPMFYKCKIEGCEFQGAWNAKQAHFEIKHPEEWFEVTGCEAKVHECPVDDCDYTTTRSNYVDRHLKKMHPEYEKVKRKKGKKSKM